MGSKNYKWAGNRLSPVRFSRNKWPIRRDTSGRVKSTIGQFVTCQPAKGGLCEGGEIEGEDQVSAEARQITSTETAEQAERALLKGLEATKEEMETN